MRPTFYLIGLVILVSAAIAGAQSDQRKFKETENTGSEHAISDLKSEHAKRTGKKYSHDHEKSQKGKKDVVLHKTVDEETGGKKHHSNDHKQTHLTQHEEGHGKHSGNSKQADKQNKGNFVKGFREIYHKDEHKKMDSFYSNKHKKGEWHKFGTGKSKHQAYKHDKDSNGKYKMSKKSGKHGKDTKYSHGTKSSDHKAHQSQQGYNKQHSKHEKYGKKTVQS